MTTKEKLLSYLEDSKGNFVSGEELAVKLNISRAAVCKAVKVLKQDGCEIEAVTNRGYRLNADSDILSSQGIEKLLEHDLHVLHYKCVDSTNAVLRTLAEQGAKEGTVVVAGGQEQGRGRSGRSFYSPSDTGIYMSILLRPVDVTTRQFTTLTSAAAVAVCDAIDYVSGKETQIKWVNDVFYNGKKICGILTEAVFGMETLSPEYVVVGVGINTYYPEGGFPEELRDIAGALWEHVVSNGRNRVVAEFLNNFWKMYKSGNPEDFLDDYKRRSLVIGKDIKVIAGGIEREAKALGIDDDCRLIVRYVDGQTDNLSYGEVQIRPQN